MANSASARKRIRQRQRRTEINRNRMSRIKTFIRKVESAVARGDYDGARSAFSVAEPEISRGASKGVLHRNNAARKISRLSSKIKTLDPSIRA